MTDVEIIPCLNLIKDTPLKSALFTMDDKVHEEVNELSEAISIYIATAKLKDREHVLEEGVDVLVAVTTLLSSFASLDEISLEIQKVNIKNQLRGYHKEDEV